MKYGLIGEHLGHSFSSEIHALCASYEYELLELSPDEVGAFMKRAEFSAINVTIPYKKTVIPYLDEVDELAKKIGSVNTVVNRGGKLYGYNTDLFGMIALLRHAGIDIKNKKVLILGTGGTSHTVRALCEHCGAREYITVSRKSSEIAVSYEEAYRDHSDAEVIINTTPCGMFPYADGGGGRAAEPIDISAFSNLCGVVDAVYNPLRTNLVQKARERGIPASGGLYMLVAQGVLASRLFLGDVGEPDDEFLESIYKKIKAQKENTVLIGMPGSGKSTVGAALARELGRVFVDTDELIEKKEGKSIPEIFAELGEEGFRRIESEAVAEVSSLSGAIIATGGGAVLKGENVFRLKRNGKLFFLDRPLESLIPTEDRPLAKSADAIKKLYGERYGIYEAAADQRIGGERTVEETLKLIKDEIL